MATRSLLILAVLPLFIVTTATIAVAEPGGAAEHDHIGGDRDRPDHDRPDHDRPDHDRPDHDRPDHDRPDHDRAEHADHEIDHDVDAGFDIDHEIDRDFDHDADHGPDRFEHETLVASREVEPTERELEYARELDDHIAEREAAGEMGDASAEHVDVKVTEHDDGSRRIHMDYTGGEAEGDPDEGENDR